MTGARAGGSTASADEIRELRELSGEDWDALRCGEDDPFGIAPLGLTWRSKDLHFILYRERRAASHVSILLRHEIRVGARRVAVTGVAGVITRKELRRRGLAQRVLNHAIREVLPRADTSFALLFCLPGLVELYRKLGWTEVAAPVRADQPGGVVALPLRTLVLPLEDIAFPDGELRLDSLPW